VKRAIEAFLLRQLSDAMPERLLDLPKSALVLHRFEYEGKVYPGTQDWVEVTHEGKRCKATGEMLSKPAEEVRAPGSVIRKWREKRWVQLLTDGSLESGPWDIFSLPEGARGYRYWDEGVPDDSVQYTIEPENEFSNLWVPLRELGKPLYFLKWRQCTEWPLKGEPGAGVRFIDLSSRLDAMHRKMVSAAY
jgi:hypothetical protein